MSRPQGFKVINGQWVPIYKGENMSVIKNTPFEDLLNRVCDNIEKRLGLDPEEPCEKEECDDDCPACDPDPEC